MCITHSFKRMQNYRSEQITQQIKLHHDIAAVKRSAMLHFPIGTFGTFKQMQYF